MNLKECGIMIDRRYAGSIKHFQCSASRMTLLRGILQAFASHAKGRLLDVGAGRRTYQPFIQKYVEQYVCSDISTERGTVDFISDAMSLSVSSNSFDTIFCAQVLEHLPRPQDALSEYFRVLRPGGKAIISVPHLSNLHNVPNDYFRFTPYGIKTLAEAAGFEVLEINPAGGFFCFVGHLVSSANF